MKKNLLFVLLLCCSFVAFASNAYEDDESIAYLCDAVSRGSTVDVFYALATLSDVGKTYLQDPDAYMNDTYNMPILLLVLDRETYYTQKPSPFVMEEICNFLLEHGANANAYKIVAARHNKEDNTHTLTYDTVVSEVTAHVVAGNLSIKLLEKVLEKAAETAPENGIAGLNWKNYFGQTPLEQANKAKRSDVVRLLEKYIQ